ncbi:hypothetical protein MP638_005012 [Amoeboaphelidium occidentale]|nr:hypothetical protein MP638_005012 [Amoeboaphelidium occidentale]
MKFLSIVNLIAALALSESISAVVIDGGRRRTNETELRELREVRKERAFGREVVNKNIYQVFSASKNHSEKSGVGFSIRTVPIPEFRLRAISSIDEDKAEFAVGTVLLGLIEVNGTITPEQSRSGFRFKEAQRNWWSDFKVDTNTDAEGVTVKKAYSTLTVPEERLLNAGLKVKIEATIGDSSTTVDGFQIDPSTVKYSLYIDDFKYKYENSKIILLTGLVARGNAFNVTDGSIRMGLDGQDGSYRWSNEYTSDNVTHVIQADLVLREDDEDERVERDEKETEEASDRMKIIAYSFEGGKNIAWDPELTVGYGGSAENTQNSHAVRETFSGIIMSLFLAFSILMAL